MSLHIIDTADAAEYLVNGRVAYVAISHVGTTCRSTGEIAAQPIQPFAVPADDE